MATAFIAVANCAVAAPLNPAYKQDEFSFYMQDLGAMLLICNDAEGPAALAAKSLGMRVSVISLDNSAPAGVFSLDLPDGPPVKLSDANENNECLILHTSGTTSRPKIVPLSHANVSTSANNVADSLRLTAEDSCLNVMPLFHIHGLIATVSSSMAAGASIYCAPEFNVLKIFSWMTDCEPSWYTAVPTMHQAILARVPRNEDVVAKSKLRLIRSSSSSLPPKVMTELQEAFGCPVVEAYGMTEAGVIGEIVISGRNIIAGYESNEKANTESFISDESDELVWFRTGDQGRLDAAGYLYITGRLKEIINRGGEKISPREVDEILMDHPSDGQAVAFAVAHEKLGEDIAAAVVLREGCGATPASLRSFASQHLADFKVPRKILIVGEIPKGPTGK